MWLGDILDSTELDRNAHDVHKLPIFHIGLWTYNQYTSDIFCVDFTMLLSYTSTVMFGMHSRPWGSQGCSFHSHDW